MQTIIRAPALMLLIGSLFTSTTAQSHAGSRREASSSSTHHQLKNGPVEQGRTLGLLRPLLGLGFNSIIASDSAGASSVLHRPIPTTAAAQSDPYYGNYGSSAGYGPQYYNGFNYYLGYPLYRPIAPSYFLPFSGGYRPQVYPGSYTAYPQYNPFAGLYPISSSRPKPIAALPPASQQSGLTPSQTTTAAANSLANSAQAAQIANLLGQLLGQQLRPLLSQGSAAAARVVPGIAPSHLQDKGHRSRHYPG